MFSLTSSAASVSVSATVSSWALATRTDRHRASSNAKHRFFIFSRWCFQFGTLPFSRLKVVFDLIQPFCQLYRQLPETAVFRRCFTSNGHYSSSYFENFCFFTILTWVYHKRYVQTTAALFPVHEWFCFHQKTFKLLAEKSCQDPYSNWSIQYERMYVFVINFVFRGCFCSPIKSDIKQKPSGFY